MAERMKRVLNSVIENDQQGFIKDGDITGNLLLVKEIIEYCKETDTQGALLLMDFKKAYDRVSRETMMSVLEAMNFGPDLLQIVRTMYTEVGAKVEVNGSMTAELETGGGVRQGCPLSPYLFICILEVMAISVRDNPQVEGMLEPDSGDHTKSRCLLTMQRSSWANQASKQKKREKRYGTMSGCPRARCMKARQCL